MNAQSPKTTTLRIIGGIWRSRTVRFPLFDAVRPTPDRVRETLFNWLGQDLSGWTTLEPYAGSGILSFEALSRGARHAVAWDSNRVMAQALKTSAGAFGTPAMEVHHIAAEEGLRAEKRFFDVIFLDPPFSGDSWGWLLPACAALLKSGAFIYAEAGKTLSPPPPLTRYREGKAGQVRYHLFQKP
ncbi:MAG: 16S rRNA (guanine(966)-N(2))-methyltransferase RsmD [Burkholderiales bacterium]|jgi:16S rRNA (guanine(966)-N(2))-methyltransferase RsmD|nr:16S rRNA (guanine(966)-N(2))-methyltransferase RsmD [Burkholderiales bacterium]